MAAVAPRSPTYVVTGASQGIGRAIAEGLAARGPATLALVARRGDVLRTVAQGIEANRAGVRVVPYAADLFLQSEVRRLAATIGAEHPRLDALVNNAGGLFSPRRETSEGVERTFALNVLAPLLLTELLRPALRSAAPARVVMVASAAHRGARLDLADLEAHRRYQGYRVYARSKLALIELTEVLAARYRPDGIDVNSFHPGFIASGFGQNNSRLGAVGFRWLEAIAGRSPARGARSGIALAADPAWRGTTGRYFSGGRPVLPSGAARTPGQAEALFAACAGRLGLAG